MSYWKAAAQYAVISLCCHLARFHSTAPVPFTSPSGAILTPQGNNLCIDYKLYPTANQEFLFQSKLPQNSPGLPTLVLQNQYHNFQSGTTYYNISSQPYRAIVNPIADTWIGRNRIVIYITWSQVGFRPLISPYCHLIRNLRTVYFEIGSILQQF